MSCTHERTVEDAQTSQVICADCNQVLPGRSINTSYSSKTCTTLGLSPLNNFSMGLSTIIKPDGLDYAGRKVNRKMVTYLVDSSRKAKTSPAVNKNKFRGIVELQRICQTLDIPKNVQEKTKNKFIQFCQKGYLKGRHLYSCICCILLITAAGEEHPLSINQILRATSTTRKRINMDYHSIYQLYEEAPKTMASAAAHAEKLISIVRPTGWAMQKNYEAALWIHVAKLDARGIVGRRALITMIAASVDYLKKQGYPALPTFLKVTGLNKNTISNKLDELVRETPDLLL